MKGPVSLPDIAQPVLQGKLDVELNKTDQRIESGIDATVAHINEDACLTLERASLATYFDAFRAPVTAGFEADTQGFCGENHNFKKPKRLFVKTVLNARSLPILIKFE